MQEYNLLRIIISFVLVLSLIGVCAVALRWWMKKNPAWMGAGQGAGRLQIIETKMLDARRKLVLVRRDNQEHLLLLSPEGNVVIERVDDGKN